MIYNANPSAPHPIAGYTILHAIEYYLQLTLWTQTPLFVPIYTEDEYTIQNPAVGYYDLMFAPICYNEEKGPLGAACVWAHGDNALTILDNELVSSQTGLVVQSIVGAILPLGLQRIDSDPLRREGKKGTQVYDLRLSSNMSEISRSVESK